MESNGIAIIAVNPGCGDDRPSKITTDVFRHYFGIAEIWFCIDIEAMFVLAVALCFDFFERWSDCVFQFIEKSCTESVTQIVVVKVFHMAPETIIAETAFGEKAVDVGIPFEVTTKSVEDHDIAGRKIFGMVQFEKHARYDTGDGMEKAVEERTVVKEEVTEIFINGKNAMTMLDIDEPKSHTVGAFHGIFVAAGWTKAAVTAKRDKLEVAAMRASVHGATK